MNKLPDVQDGVICENNRIFNPTNSNKVNGQNSLHPLIQRSKNSPLLSPITLHDSKLSDLEFPKFPSSHHQVETKGSQIKRVVCREAFPTKIEVSSSVQADPATMIPGTYGSQFGFRSPRNSRRTRTSPLSLSANSHKRQKYLDKKRNIDLSEEHHSRKRISNSDDEEESNSFQPRRKIFINEDKMAARLHRLTLNPTPKEIDFSSLSWYPNKKGISSNPKKALEEIDKRLSDSDEEEIETISQTIEVSEPLKAMLKHKNEVLPESITKMISSPCTDLVLWQPPISSLEQLCRESKTTSSEYLSEEPNKDVNFDMGIERPISYASDDNMEL